MIQRDMPVIVSIHPQAPLRLWSVPLAERFKRAPGLRAIEIISYFDFMKLMSRSRLVLTDSGDVQEEATILQVPCLSLRDNNERAATIEHDTSKIVGTQTGPILEAYRNLMCLPDVKPQGHEAKTPPLWDGNAADRIAHLLFQHCGFPKVNGIGKRHGLSGVSLYNRA